MSDARVTIAFNCTAYDDLPSGARVRAVGLAAGLLAEGAAVHLYTARGKTLAPDVEAELGTALPEDRFEELPTSLEPSAPAVRAARSGRWFRRHLARADLFVTDYYPVVDHVPTALTIHDLRYLASPADEPRQRVLWFRTFYARMAARAPHVVVPSAAIGGEAAFHLGIDPARIAIVQNGLSRGLLTAPADSIERAHLLWIGTPEHRKRLRFLLRAYALAAADQALAPLILVGRGGETVDLPEEADPLIARGLVRAEGVVSSERLVALIRGAVALLHPSRYEGFGMPVAEAIALGTPVLAARISAIEEVAQGGAVLLPPDHLDSWRAAIAAAGGTARRVVAPAPDAIASVRAVTWRTAARALLALVARA